MYRQLAGKNTVNVATLRTKGYKSKELYYSIIFGPQALEGLRPKKLKGNVYIMSTIMKFYFQPKNL